MNVYLWVWNRYVVLFEHLEYKVANGAFGLNAAFWIGAAKELVFDGGFAEFINADVFELANIFEFISAFGDLVHDVFGLLEFEVIWERYDDAEFDAGFGSALDVAVRKGDDVTSGSIANLGGANTDAHNSTSDVADGDGFANFVVIVGNDANTANDVFERVLNSKTHDDGCDAEASDKIGNVNAVNLKNDEKDDREEERAEEATNHGKESTAAVILLNAQDTFSWATQNQIDEDGD